MDWQASLDLVRNGQADVHGGLLWSPERNLVYDYGQALSHVDSQLFFANSLRGSDVNYYLLHESVGVVTGGYEEYYARKHFPTTRLRTFDDNDAMLRAAFSGELDAFIADLQVANFYIYTSADPTRFIPVRHLYSDEIRFAVAKGNQALLQELEQGFSRIGEADRERIVRKWMHIETVYPVHLWPWLLAIGGLVLMAYIIQLRRAVASRTAELIQANARLERLAGTDSMTGILNRRAFLPLLEQRLASGQASALLLFDLDRFKGSTITSVTGSGMRYCRPWWRRYSGCCPPAPCLPASVGRSFASACWWRTWRRCSSGPPGSGGRSIATSCQPVPERSASPSVRGGVGAGRRRGGRPTGVVAGGSADVWRQIAGAQHLAGGQLRERGGW